MSHLAPAHRIDVNQPYDPKRPPEFRRFSEKIDFRLDEIQEKKTLNPQEEILSYMIQHGRINLLSKGSVLNAIGMNRRWVYLVLGGELDLIHCQPDGGEILLGRCSSGDLYGHDVVFGVTRSDLRAQANTDLECVRVSGQVFTEMVLNSVQCTHYVATIFGKELTQLTQKLSSVTFDSLDQRLYDLLLELCSSIRALPHRHGALLNESRVDISNYLSCSREAVGRSLLRLRKGNYIRMLGNRILVHGIYRND